VDENWDKKNCPISGSPPDLNMEPMEPRPPESPPVQNISPASPVVSPGQFASWLLVRPPGKTKMLLDHVEVDSG